MEKTPTLHLGVTMAGAVSGGAYTAGVIDYLIEAINRWEKAKKSEAHLPPDKKTVPTHRIQIEAIGGASAGGITAALAAMSCYSGILPVSDPKQSASDTFKPANNLLFDTWVNLSGQNDDREVIRRMLDVSDLRGAGGIPSLLNSTPIDHVAERAIQHVEGKTNVQWPSFVAPDLEILLTLCSLRGVQVGIEFNSGNSSWHAGPSHQMSIHKQFVRFTTGRFDHPGRAIPIDTGNHENLQQLIEFAKATAAFPVGLRARSVRLPREHVRHQFGTFFRLSETTLDNIFAPDVIPEFFEFTSVDGGALNNEPFGEIAAIMHERGIHDYAMILVDPFPNFGDPPKEYQFQPYLKNQIFPLLGALRNQGMLKENDLREVGQRDSGELRAGYRKNMIYPTRHEFDAENKVWITKKDNPIACGALDGFSGFLSREFRHHDYYLGRKNCRNFLRGYFTMEYDLKNPAANHAIFKDWTPQMIEKYKAYWRQDTPDIVHLPIIPLPDFIETEQEEWAKHKGREADFDDTMKKIARTMPVAFPRSRFQLVNRLRFPLAWRLFWMAHRLTDNLFSPRNKQRARWWRIAIGFVLKWLVRILLFLILPFLFVYFSGRILRVVRRDLAKNGLLPSRKRRRATPPRRP